MSSFGWGGMFPDWVQKRSDDRRAAGPSTKIHGTEFLEVRNFSFLESDESDEGWGFSFRRFHAFLLQEVVEEGGGERTAKETTRRLVLFCVDEGDHDVPFKLLPSNLTVTSHQRQSNGSQRQRTNCFYSRTTRHWTRKIAQPMLVLSCWDAVGLCL